MVGFISALRTTTPERLSGRALGQVAIFTYPPCSSTARHEWARVNGVPKRLMLLCCPLGLEVALSRRPKAEDTPLRRVVEHVNVNVTGGARAEVNQAEVNPRAVSGFNQEDTLSRTGTTKGQARRLVVPNRSRQLAYQDKKSHSSGTRMQRTRP